MPSYPNEGLSDDPPLRQQNKSFHIHCAEYGLKQHLASGFPQIEYSASTTNTACTHHLETPAFVLESMKNRVRPVVILKASSILDSNQQQSQCIDRDVTLSISGFFPASIPRRSLPFAFHNLAAAQCQAGSIGNTNSIPL
ncbi:hypothetical protein Mal65_05510 [Crateriforma conspicua]|nr:hypothetical protein Mal65_05510 [Crateriforma conspicua]